MAYSNTVSKSFSNLAVLSKKLIPVNSHLSESELLRKKFFYLLMLALNIGAVVWAGICYINNLYLAFCVPVFYVVASMINYCCLLYSQITLASYYTQIGMSILLPVAFQTLLGGYAVSGVVMLWSLVSLISVMIIEVKRTVYVWFGIYLVFSIIGVIIEPFSVKFSNGLVSDYSGLLLCLNLSMVSIILFSLSRFFILKQAELRYKLKMRHEMLAEYNKEINDKNQEIRNSIAYAQRIQTNILPQHYKLDREFKEHFIFFKPKDTISGDVYWFAKFQDVQLLAIIDCTGHGVPGGFMSMMAYTLLNEIVYSKGLRNPGEIMTELRVNVIHALKQRTSGNRDGMDLSIVSINQNTKELKFCGANSNLIWTDSAGNMELIKGTRKSIGGVNSGDIKNFEEVTLEYTRGTDFYLYTDGVIDQFGEETNKKLGSRRFMNWINDQAGLPLSSQGSNFVDFWNEWKGQEEQTDDVLLAGFKI